jgi:protoporphyrinogen oxidase
MTKQTAIIIGAGPAGLTAAYELLTRTDIHPIVLERSTYMGGISRTIEYKGNRMDLGGHRFFSKSDRVMEWWLAQLPLAQNGEAEILDLRMLVRSRKSRIYFLRRFFEYPIQLSKETLMQLGLRRTLRIGFSYLRSALFPIKPVSNLEEFFINRFGRELYMTFFKSYTEKVWGVPCSQISADWGAQRIKGLSIRKAIAHFLKQAAKPRESDIAQKQTETSLIEQFLYPKFGPGQMWEEVARKVIALGGEIVTCLEVNRLATREDRVVSVTATDGNGTSTDFFGDYFFSTTSVQELVRAMGDAVPASAREISEGLQYRDFITVGLLLKKLKLRDPGTNAAKLISDNWIYIQEPDVQVGVCRFSTIGVRTSCHSPTKCGSAQNISVTKATSCGASRTPIWRDSRWKNWRGSTSWNRRMCWTQQWPECPEPIPRILEPMRGLRNCGSAWTVLKTCIWWAATACTNTITRTIRC